MTIIFRLAEEVNLISICPAMLRLLVGEDGWCGCLNLILFTGCGKLFEMTPDISGTREQDSHPAAAKHCPPP